MANHVVLAVSSSKTKLEAIMTSATCGTLLVLLVGAVIAYRYHRHLSKLKHDVFFDVAGIFLSIFL